MISVELRIRKTNEERGMTLSCIYFIYTELNFLGRNYNMCLYFSVSVFMLAIISCNLQKIHFFK